MTTYYVSPDGNNGAAGTADAPWRTINWAVSKNAGLGAGDEIVVRPGVYSEQIWFVSGGSAEGQLTIRSEIPGAAQLRPPEGGFNTVNVRADYVTVEGFDVQGGAGNGIEVWGVHHVEILNNKVHDSGGSGIQFVGSEFVLVEGNETWGNALTSTYQQSGISIFHPRNITGDTTTPGYRTIVRNNISHDNATGPSVAGNHTDGNGIIIDDFRSTQDPKYPSYDFPTLVENNVAFNNGGKGIHVTWSDNVTVRNNTVWHNNWDNLNSGTWRGELSNQEGSNNIWINNIAVANFATNPNNTAIGNYSSSNYVNQNTIWLNNLTFNGVPGDPSFRVTGINAAPRLADGNLLGIDPQFIDPAGADFRLLPTSPALDAGLASFGLSVTDLNGSPRELGIVDVGAHESGTVAAGTGKVEAGSPGADVMKGTAAADTLVAVGGNDTIYGSGGNDRLFGGDGADRLDGGAGNDTLYGGAGDDTLLGGTGDDTFHFGFGRDTADGGKGNDLLSFRDAAAPLVLTLGKTLTTTSLAIEDGTGALIVSTVKFKAIESIEGTHFDDKITGNALANVLSGGGGHDVLTGLAGNDTLNGNDGNDRLIGGIGTDRLTGGVGSDIFVLASKSGTDTVLDFTDSEDKFAFDSASFKLGIGTNLQDYLVIDLGSTGIPKAPDAGHGYFLVNATGIYWDSDGTGKLVAEKLASFTSLFTLDASDFILT